MTTKAQQEQAQRLRQLHEEWRDPRKTHPDRVETLKKEWERDGRVKSMDLDFIGHANLRDLLCYADPAWTWRHAGYDANGNRVPLIDRGGKGEPRGLWIELTVHGKTQPGYGTVEAKVAAVNAMKELIGDALRNAAQSFGIAVCLWARMELAELEAHQDGLEATSDDEEAPEAPTPAPAPEAPQAPAQAPEEPAQPPQAAAPAAVNGALTAEAAGDLDRDGLEAAVFDRLKAVRGDMAKNYANARRTNDWPADLTQATDDQLRAILAFFAGTTTDRVVAGSASS